LEVGSSGSSTVEGSTVLTVKACVVDFGTSALDLSNTYLIKPDGVSEISHDVSDGFVVVEYTSINISTVFYPSDTNVYTSQEFSIQLTVDDVARLFGFSADIAYPSSGVTTSEPVPLAYIHFTAKDCDNYRSTPFR
jgi:hypothetical protein